MQESPRLVFIGWEFACRRTPPKMRTRLDIAGIATANTPEARSQLPAGIPFLESPEQLAGFKRA